MATGTVRVKGYRETIRAFDRAGKETKKAVRDTYREVGEIVRVPAAAQLARLSARSAAGFRTVVRTRGVTVEQTLRRTTGLRRDWAARQQREILEPTLAAREGEVVEAFEDALDKVADHFDNRI